MEITGKLVAIGDTQQGQSARGAWTKQTIVVETMDQYPKKIACLLFNDMVDKAQALNLVDTLALGIDIESREFNGRWYTDVKVWKMEGIQENLGIVEEEY